ncbi:MAG: hypothetical protein IJI60_02895 [Bacilli bacterium]|nr:hypothetical protein [Bacilli bacterium]
MTKQEEIRFNRLEKLKQATILHNLKDINLDNSSDLYEKIMRNFFSGILDEEFLSTSLENVPEEQKREIFTLARKYQDLCFYQGDFAYWKDSIGGIYLSDLDLVCMKVLDHFDFLLDLVKVGGESVLKQLESFQKGAMSQKGSVIDFLRSTFQNDEMLKNILIEMSKEHGPYYIFNNEQKEILCTYPEGILYKKGKIPPQEIAKEICQTMKQEISMKELSRDTFEEIVLSIYWNNHKENFS